MKNQVLRIDREQAEKLAELGYRLQQLRQQRGISLEEVAARTLIPVRTLAAIEGGNRQHLPEPVYIQGFIRRYADAIGINGAEFASAFPTYPIVASPRRAVWRGVSFQAQLRPQHLYLLYIVLVVSAVSGLSYMLNRSAQTAGLPSAVIPPVQPVSGPPALPSGPTNGLQPNLAVGGTTSHSQPILADQKAVRVELMLKAQSWLRVVADGKTEFEGILPEGTKRTWIANEQVVVRAGDAGAVLVSLNQGKAKQLGEPGSVEEVTFGKSTQTAKADPSDTSLTASNAQVPHF